MKKITSVYFGIRDKCCCGCAGNHHKVTESNPNRRLVSRAVNTIAMVRVEGGSILDEPTFTSAEYNDRIVVLYYNAPPVADHQRAYHRRYGDRARCPAR